MTAPRRIAFFGGTFDPPHRGHLAVAGAAADRFQLDQVLFAPVARQPLKPGAQHAPILHRFAMTALATEDDPRFLVSTLDAVDSGPPDHAPNYTVDTLEELHRLYPHSELFALAGADSFRSLPQWRNPARLLELCDWIVAARPGYSLDDIESALPPGLARQPPQRAAGSGDSELHLLHPGGARTRILLLRETDIDISATEVRSALEHDAWTTQDIPPRVARYIEKYSLYRPGTLTSGKQENH